MTELMGTTETTNPSVTSQASQTEQMDCWHTRWSLIIARQSMNPETAEKAIEQLLEQYRGLLIRYAARRVSPHDLEDVIHDFLICVVREKLIARADPARGSFRSLVKKALDHFLKERYRKENSMRRNPAGREDELQVHSESVSSGIESPDDFYDLCWFTELVERSRQELWSKDSPEWAVTELLLLHVPREHVAARFGLTSAKLSELIRKVRRELREMVQFQLQQLCGSREIYEQEWEALSRYVKKPPPA